MLGLTITNLKKLNNNPTNQSREIKLINQNISRNKKICNETQDFHMENPHTNCEDKKSRGLRPLF